tara:strand:- start:776 stop:1027 length:252 start_codon:yes stop_codon:yes gene_type:complete
MIIYIVYLIIALIFIFLIYTASKAISRGMKAKNKSNYIDLSKPKKNKDKLSIAEEFEKLKKLHQEGFLSNEEFKKAKDKIINN